MCIRGRASRRAGRYTPEVTARLTIVVALFVILWGCSDDRAETTPGDTGFDTAMTPDFSGSDATHTAADFDLDSGLPPAPDLVEEDVAPDLPPDMGLPDLDEMALCRDYCEVFSRTEKAATADCDRDGIKNVEEYQQIGTDPCESDSDGDSLDDLAELQASTDPLSPDSDGDGIEDGLELLWGYDPNGLDRGDTAVWLRIACGEQSPAAVHSEVEYPWWYIVTDSFDRYFYFGIVEPTVPRRFATMARASSAGFVMLVEESVASTARDAIVLRLSTLGTTSNLATRDYMSRDAGAGALVFDLTPSNPTGVAALRNALMKVVANSSFRRVVLPEPVEPTHTDFRVAVSLVEDYPGLRIVGSVLPKSQLTHPASRQFFDNFSDDNAVGDWYSTLSTDCIRRVRSVGPQFELNFPIASSLYIRRRDGGVVETLEYARDYVRTPTGVEIIDSANPDARYAISYRYFEPMAQ